MDINDIIARYAISVTVDDIEILYRVSDNEDVANNTYDEYYKHITGVYDCDKYHIIIKIMDYELGTYIKKFDSIEDKT